jgi:hypothetical protein
LGDLPLEPPSDSVDSVDKQPESVENTELVWIDLPLAADFGVAWRAPSRQSWLALRDEPYSVHSVVRVLSPNWLASSMVRLDSSTTHLSVATRRTHSFHTMMMVMTR